MSHGHHHHGDEHNHQHEHEHSHEHEHARPPGKKLHQDWRLWVIVLLMIALMVVYLATLDFRK